MNMSHSISFAMNAEKTISCSMPLSDIASDECRNNCLDNTSQMVRWCFNSIANSPVSNLAFNLSELSTERKKTIAFRTFIQEPCPTDFKVPPARLCHNTSRLDEDSQETCFPLQFSPVKWPEARTLSFSVAPLETTSVAGFSPVPVTQLVHGSICTDHDDVDSFVDIFDQDLSNIAKRYARSRSVDVQTRPTKRSGPPQEFSAPKKFCRADQSFSDNEDDVDDAYKGADRRRRLVRCHSETDASIKFAVCRMSEQPDLIADSSKPCVLPTIRGKHQDLKSIISATLAGLVRGHYDSMVGEFQIIDSRYPYEFYGGHIKGARNIYTREGLVQEYLRNPQSAGDPSKRLILVFHCEFSSERGPSLYRFLRSQDRASNKECYPFLHYPEIYLLEGGYKVFFENFKELCQPQAYTHMLHKDFSEDLRKFRAKSKSWAGERNGSTRPGLRSNLKF